MSGAEQRPLPHPTEWSRPFWEAVAGHKLLIQTCRSCGALIMYPKPFCPTCLSSDLTWTEVSGRGTVYSFTVQEAGAPTGFRDLVPYVLAIVRLEEGVQLMSNIVGPGATEVRCDDPVQLDFEQVDGGIVLPVFRLTKGVTDPVPVGAAPTRRNR